MVAGLQGSRMNDQRASLPFPGLTSQAMGQLLGEETKVPDDSFFDMVMRCQVSANMSHLFHAAQFYFSHTFHWLFSLNEISLIRLINRYQ